MRHLGYWAALVVVVGLSVAALAADKKEGDKEKEPAGEKLVPLGQVTGTLKSTGSDKTISVGVQIRYAQPNPAAAAQQMQQQLQLLRSPPWQRQQLLAQMMRGGGGSGVTIHTVTQNLDLEPASDMKVRILNPPPAFDEKGNAKRYTTKELKEMKGPNASLVGYTADMSSLQSGQVVAVFLARPAVKPQPAGAKKDKDTPEDNKPVIQMIVILSEPPSGG